MFKKEKTLIVFAGLPGVGKSTACYYLHQNLPNSYFLDIDKLITQLGKTDFFSKLLPLGEDKLRTKLNIHKAQKVKECLLNNTYVIIDALFSKLSDRLPIYNVAREVNAKIIVIEIVCPEDVVKERILKDVSHVRNNPQGRWEEYLKVKKRWERISLIERLKYGIKLKQIFSHRGEMEEQILKIVKGDLMLNDKEIKQIVNKAVNFTLEQLKNKRLISLYVAGTILTKDRRPDSDIDLFGIVSSDFDMKEEEKINVIFKAKQEELCGGIETRFRAFPICSLEGGEQIGVVKFFHPQRILKRFPLYKLVWGKKINFAKDFSLKPMGAKEETLWLIQNIEKSMKALRSGTETFPYDTFPKQVIELVRVEAEKERGFKYDLSYLKLSKHLRNEENHIIHRIMAYRNGKPTRKEIVSFCDEVELYIANLKKRIREWK